MRSQIRKIVFFAGIALSLSAAPPVPPPAISGVSIAPSAVTGGESAVGTVSLAAPAPAGGLLVGLASDNPAVTGGASIQIAQGQLSGTFSITTAPIAASANATLTATIGKSSATTTLNVNPPCVTAVALQLSVTNSVTGEGTLSGSVGLNGAAPSGGTAINLLSGGGNIGMITVPQGKSTEAVNLNLTDVTQLKDMTVTAQNGACTGVSAPIKKDI